MINLIGIHGEINHGKDTIGDMVQYNKSFVAHNTTFDEFAQYSIRRKEKASGWERKKFAHKLKLIASILTGQPVENFEDRNFKENYFINLETWHQCWKKDIPLHLQDILLVETPAELNQHIKEGIFNIYIPFRLFLQYLGTDVGRARVSPDLWVNALFADYKSIGGTLDGKTKIVYPNWLITDVRFPNEAQAIKNRGGIVISVRRPNQREVNLRSELEEQLAEGIHLIGSPGDFRECSKQEKIDYEVGIARALMRESLHASETSLDNWTFDHIIMNDNTLDSLYVKVNDFISKFRI